MIKCPVTYFSGKARSFNLEWFRSYDWLQYSVSIRMQHFVSLAECLVHQANHTSRPEQAFTVDGSGTGNMQWDQKESLQLITTAFHTKSL